MVMDPRKVAGAAALFAATAVAAVLSAGAAGAETLQEALARAYFTNPTLEGERASLRAQDESVAVARAGQRPALSLAGAVSRSNSVSTTSVATTPTSLTLSLSQTLYRGGRIMNGIEQAELQVLSARARLVATEQQVLSSAVNAYVNLVRDQALVQLNRSSEQVLRSELDATRNRFELGAATRTDIAQAESRVSAAAAGRIQAEGQLQSSIATYWQVLGQAPENIAAPDPLAGLPNTLEEAVAIGLDENPALILADLAGISAERSIEAANGAMLPTVSLSASSRRSADWVHWGAETMSNSIGLSLSMPLYQGGAEYSSIRSAKQSRSQALIGLDAARRLVEAQVTQAWHQLAAARAGIYSRSEQVRASEVALEAVRQEEAVGARTLLDVLNAQQDMLNARVALVTSRRDEIVASYALLAAMGRLTAGALALPVGLYDPTAHYLDVRDAWIGFN